MKSAKIYDFKKEKAKRFDLKSKPKYDNITLWEIKILPNGDFKVVY